MRKIPALANHYKVSENFEAYEFESKRTRKCWVHPLVIEFAQKARDKIGAPLKITSGCRTWWENMYFAKSKATNSYHIKGCAIDCYAPSLKNLYQLEAILILSGFTHVIRYKTHCHADIRRLENAVV